MSVASSNESDDDTLLHAINDLSEPDLRAVLLQISIVYPEVVQAALNHHQFISGGDDLHSVSTLQVSNTTSSRGDEPLPPHGMTHPSRRGIADTDEDEMDSQPSHGRPFMPQRSRVTDDGTAVPLVQQRHGHVIGLSSDAPAPPRRRMSPPP